MNAAETYVQTSILTQGLFNANPIQFVTGRTAPHNLIVPLGAPSYYPDTTDNVITLPELFGRDYEQVVAMSSPTDYISKSVSFTADPSKALATITNNAKTNFIPMVMQTVSTRVFFTVLKKVTSKQRSMLNQGFKAIGVSEVKV